MELIMSCVTALGCRELAKLLNGQREELLIIDSRSFLEYNDSHVLSSVNVGSSKLIKKRLEQNKIGIMELLENAQCRGKSWEKIVVYDQNTKDLSNVPNSHFFRVIVQKLISSFKAVHFLKGGFAEFGLRFPNLCESKRATGCLLSLSTPCMTTRECPPTRILPFMFLGCEEDAKNDELLRTNRITYVLNVSHNATDCTFVSNGHYMKIPVADNGTANIIDNLDVAFDFIEKAHRSEAVILVHCVGGVSRSATVAIAYVMKHLNMSLDNAYRYVKDKRPAISPNLNFMGQLLQFEQRLKANPETTGMPKCCS